MRHANTSNNLMGHANMSLCRNKDKLMRLSSSIAMDDFVFQRTQSMSLLEGIKS